MKIFNWVHRRFNNHKDDESAKEANISDHQLISDHEISIDIDQSQFVVKNNNVSVFSSWKGGILTIGTFGYDPLKDDDEELHVNIDSYPGNEQGAIIISADKEKVSSHMESDTDQIIIDSDDHEEEDEEVMPLMMHAAAVYAHEDLLKMEDIGDKIEEAVELLVIKKERTTLAELFYAEKSQEKKGNEKQPIAIAGEKMLKTKANLCDKNQISSAAAKKKSAGQDSTARPMGKRLHRMVRRMLKKKIHPELGLNSSKHVDHAAAKRAEDTREFDSLLPIQGAVI